MPSFISLASATPLQKPASSNALICEAYLKRPLRFLKDVQRKAGTGTIRAWCTKVLKLLDKDAPPVEPAKVSTLSAAGYDALGFTKGRFPAEVCE